MIWTFWGQRRFGPGDLFVSGAPGAFYDPSDFSTLFQDASGTTPVTAVEQPVGLMLDRSRGLVATAAPIDGNLNTATWTKGTGWTAPTARSLVCDGTQTSQSDVAATYNKGSSLIVRWTFTISAISGTVFVFPTGGIPQSYTTTGLRTVVSDTVNNNNIFRALAGTTCTITDIRIELIAGNHATQSVNAARPTLRARYNLLTRTEEFDHSDWTKTNATVTANAGVAPDGTTTADKVVPNNATNNGRVQRSLTVVGSTTYTVSIYAKAAEWSWLAFRVDVDNAHSVWFNLANGTVGNREADWLTASMQSVGDGWYRCVATYRTVGTAYIWRFLPTNQDTQFLTGDGTSGILLWGAQLMHAADQTATGGAYQRVGAATDYAVGGPFRPYLAFDGSDDSMSTAAIDFSARDEMSVFAGITKLSDVAQGSIIELTTDPTSVAGSFAINGPGSAAAANYVFRSGGTAFPSVNGGVTVAAPITNVVGLIADISADQLAARINGAQTNFTSADQGTGNFANASLFIGSRNNASLRYNGRIYSLIVLGRTATAAEIAATESWVNSRTGAY